MKESPRGEIGRHKGLKTKLHTTLNRLYQTTSDNTLEDVDKFNHRS